VGAEALTSARPISDLKRSFECLKNASSWQDYAQGTGRLLGAYVASFQEERGDRVKGIALSRSGLRGCATLAPRGGAVGR